MYHATTMKVRLKGDELKDYEKDAKKLLSVLTFIDEDTTKKLLATEAEME